MMRKALPGFLLLIVGALSIAAQPTEWNRYKNTAGNFSVLFPGDPQDTENKNDGGVKSHTLLVTQKPAVYTVIYTAMEEEQKVDESTYDTFKTAVFRELAQCTVDVERPAAPGIRGYIGRWYRLKCAMGNGVTILGNLYWGRHYAYAVMVMFPSNEAAPQMANKFQESFAVLDPAK